jgi:hypothetical protein
VQEHQEVQVQELVVQAVQAVHQEVQVKWNIQFRNTGVRSSGSSGANGLNGTSGSSGNTGVSEFKQVHQEIQD